MIDRRYFGIKYLEEVNIEDRRDLGRGLLMHRRVQCGGGSEAEEKFPEVEISKATLLMQEQNRRQWQFEVALKSQGRTN